MFGGSNDEDLPSSTPADEIADEIKDQPQTPPTEVKTTQKTPALVPSIATHTRAPEPSRSHTDDELNSVGLTSSDSDARRKNKEKDLLTKLVRNPSKHKISSIYNFEEDDDKTIKLPTLEIKKININKRRKEPPSWGTYITIGIMVFLCIASIACIATGVAAIIPAVGLSVLLINIGINHALATTLIITGVCALLCSIVTGFLINSCCKLRGQNKIYPKNHHPKPIYLSHSKQTIELSSVNIIQRMNSSLTDSPSSPEPDSPSPPSGSSNDEELGPTVLEIDSLAKKTAETTTSEIETHLQSADSPTTSSNPLSLNH